MDSKFAIIIASIAVLVAVMRLAFDKADDAVCDKQLAEYVQQHRGYVPGGYNEETEMYMPIPLNQQGHVICECSK